MRWLAAVETLEADPLFAEAAVGELLTLPDDEWEGAAKHLFKRLSSGHAIVLLTTTRLVELVDERTLVILDEPANDGKGLRRNLVVHVELVILGLQACLFHDVAGATSDVDREN